MISSNIDREKSPIPFFTGVPNRLLNRLPPISVQYNGRMKKLFLIEFLPVAVSRNSRCSVHIIVPINRSAFIAVQPRPVTAKRNEDLATRIDLRCLLGSSSGDERGDS